VEFAFADGLATISTHNGVHRLVWYKLTSDGKPEQVLELIIPASSLDGIIEALSRLRDTKAPWLQALGR
jgi:hypothetical protein